MKPTLIIVEDVPSVRAELKALLSEEFEVVSEAGDGQTALNEIVRLGPDVVLLDLVMPGISGLEVARSVRKLPTKRPALVVLSGSRDERIQAEALAVGVYDYAFKPVDGEILKRVLRDAVAHSQAKAEI